jgi:hypothetical protein
MTTTDILLAAKEAQDLLNELVGAGLINEEWGTMYERVERVQKQLDEALEAQADAESKA